MKIPAKYSTAGRIARMTDSREQVRIQQADFNVDAEAAALMDSAPFVRVIGDASRVSTITNAVYQGYHAALDI